MAFHCEEEENAEINNENWPEHGNIKEFKEGTENGDHSRFYSCVPKIAHLEERIMEQIEFTKT